MERQVETPSNWDSMRCASPIMWTTASNVTGMTRAASSGGRATASLSGDAAREPLANVDYPRYFAKIACIRAAYGDAIKIRSGLEFGIQSITVDDYERLFAKYQDELDFVLFSMHQVDNKEF